MDNISSFMTPRLLKIASLVDKDSSVIDVGCDHGYIPIYLLKSGVAKKALAADINDGPLKAADKNIIKFGLEDRIKTCKSDGLLQINCDDFDTIIIAGMGGSLISDIMSAGVRGKTYILQPMTALENLVEFLSENGFEIISHVLAEEENHIYNILKVRDGTFSPTELQKHLGKLIDKDDLYFKYAERLIKKFNKIISGLEKSQNGDEARLKNYKNLLEELKGRIKNEQQ